MALGRRSISWVLLTNGVASPECDRHNCLGPYVGNLMERFAGSVTDGIALMLSTEDHSVRNAVALDLAETSDPRVKEALISLIQRPMLENYRGTLVYALENFKCSDLAPLLLELVQTANFEVAAHAGIIIENTDNFPHEHLEMLVTGLLDTDSATTVEWRRDLVSDLVDTLRARDSQLG